MRPDQFRVNQAWLAVKANDAPLLLAEGAFNMYLLMDAASTYIIGRAVAPVGMEAPDIQMVSHLFAKGWRERKQWPKMLLLEEGASPENTFAEVGRQHGIEVRKVTAQELAPILEGIKEALANLFAKVNDLAHDQPHATAQTPDASSAEERSPYAPIRMRNTPSWFIARDAARKGWVTPDGMVASNFYPHLRESLIHPMLDGLFAATKRGEVPPGALGETAAKIVSYEKWVPLIAQFEGNGRQIFDLHDRLTELLTHTDVKDATLSDLHTPYEAFFVRFGLQEQIRLPFDEAVGTFEYVDGAYVAYAPWDAAGAKRLKVGFVTVHSDGRQVGYPGMFFDLLPHELQMAVPEAIEASMKRRLQEDADDPAADDNSRALKSYLRAEIEDSAVLMRHCAALLFNSLFYLESIEHHLPEPTPGRDTPPDRVAKWMNSPAKRYKLNSALTSDGFAVVRLVGGEVDGPPAQASGEIGGGVRVHWRRGHWRMQPYGQQRASRRRIWIKPILVGSDLASGPDASHGHIYVPPDVSNRVQ